MSIINFDTQKKLAETQANRDNQVNNRYYLLENPVDKVSFTGKKEEITSVKNEKITFGEGVKLIAKGFWNKTKEMVKTIVKHPLKTMGILGITTVGLTALPLIGISSLTGASALALLFAGIATGKTVYHTSKAIKHNKNGEYDNVRKDLQKIGGDGLDLALSLPFVPKAIGQIKNQIKFAPAVRFNTTLWETVVKTKGLWNKVKELTKFDIDMLYKMQVKELGLKVAPELEFAPLPKGDAGGYNFHTGKLYMSTKELNPLFIGKHNSNLRHELVHFKQATAISRLNNGITGLETANINRIYKPEIEFYQNNLKAGIAARKQQLAPLDKASEAAKALEAEIKELDDYMLLLKNNPKKVIIQSRPEMIKQVQSELETLKQQKVPAAQLAQHEQALEYYKTDPGINADFYKQAIQANHGGELIAQGSAEESTALGYLEAWKNYDNSNMLSSKYLMNTLEREAYIEQFKYIYVRPDNLSVIQQGMTAITDDPT